MEDKKNHIEEAFKLLNINLTQKIVTNSFGTKVTIHTNKSAPPASLALNMFLCVLYGIIIASICVFCCGITCCQDVCEMTDDYEGGKKDKIILSNSIFA